VTETDTRRLVHLIEESPGATLEARLHRAWATSRDTYGIAVLSETDPGKIVVDPARLARPARRAGDREFLVASDASAVLEHTRSRMSHLNDGDVAVVTPEDGVRVSTVRSREQERPWTTSSGTFDADRAGRVSPLSC